MSAISFDRYIEQPIPLEPDPVFCSKVMQVASMAFAGMAIGATAFIALALAFEVSVGVYGTIGAIAGLIIGIAMAYFKQEIPSLIKYRILSLQKLEEGCMTLQQFSIIESLKKVFHEQNLTLEFHYELHTLHDRLTFLTDELNHSKMQKVWEDFLQKLNGFEVHLPDGGLHVLNCQMQLNRLKNGKIPEDEIRIEPLKQLSEEDLKQIEELEMECFGKKYVLPQSAFAQQRYQGILARYQNQILGFALYRMAEENEGEGYTLCCLGRKAAAARLGIGDRLLQIFAYQLRGINLYLQVRQSNVSAIRLYEKYGFKPKKVLLGYYSEPRETGILMCRPAIEDRLNRHLA